MRLPDHPSIALIVPLLDEREHLGRLIADVARLPVDEVVLVDGGSQDGTRELLAASGLRWIDAPRGRARQMNAGAALCRSSVLLFLHADTRIGAEQIAALRTALRGHPERQWGRFDLRIDDGRGLFALIGAMINLRSRLSGISTGDQAQFVRRALFERIGGFPDIPLMEDVAISRRLKQVAPPCNLRPPVVTSGRRWRSGGVWRTILLMWRLRWDYWRGVPPERLARRYRKAR
ncbi:MAG: glycosyltransferase [Zetaproteobacteria bacterium]|nr:MAG: glycosyltransferase [Zetaproteobacteria bacterium]